jgi:hypothetical protein
MRGYSAKHLFHAWAEHANHHLFEHAQESRMMLSHHSFCSLPKSIQSLFFFLKSGSTKLPWQQNPGHFSFKARDATSVLAE